MEDPYNIIDKFFIAYDGRWQMPPFTTSELVSRAKAAFDAINSGVELLKSALVDAEQMAPEDSHNFVEIHIVAFSKKLPGFSGEQVDLPLD